MSTKKKTEAVDTEDSYGPTTEPGGKDDVLGRLTAAVTPTDEDAFGRKAPRTALVTVKLGSIDEADYLEPGAVVVSVNRASGEVTLSVTDELATFKSSRAIVQ